MKNKELKNNDILKYSMGGLASNIDFNLMSTYLMFYLTDIAKINPLFVGSLLLVSRLIDAVTDPLMGSIADKTNTRFGKYRPYLIFGAPFLALSIIMLYSIPSGFTENQKLIYATSCYIFYVLCSTAVNIPYHSLTAILSTEPKKRNFIVACKQFMGVPAGLFINSITLPLIAFLGTGYLGWSRYSMFVAGITIIAFWLCAWGAKKSDVLQEQSKVARSPKFKELVKVIFHNRPLMLLILANIVFSFSNYVSASINIYYFKYYLGIPNFKVIMSIIGIYTVLTNTISMVAMPFIANKIGKKYTYILAMAITVVFNLMLYFVPKDNHTLVMIVITLAGFFFLNNIIWSMLPDCVEYGELKTGIKAAGTISATFIFTNKLALAITSLFIGYLLVSTGYVADQTQSPETLNNILRLRTLTPVIGATISAILILLYPISAVYHEQLLKDIEKHNINLQIYELLGKKENIKLISYCMTKLRIELNSPIEGVEELKKLSTIKGVITDGNALQIVMGPEVKKLFEDLEKIQNS